MATKTTFKTRFYKWDGKVYCQAEGGPIGLKATGTVAMIAMERGMVKFKAAVIKAGMTVHEVTKYVGDVLCLTNTLELTYHLQ